MDNVIEVKGKDLEDALLKASEQLNTTKDNVHYEIIEETNKTLFSILTPKYVIIKANLIVASKKIENTEKVAFEPKTLSEEEKENVKKYIDTFLTELLNAMNIKYSFEIIFEENITKVNIQSEDAKIIIGYRGEVLEALQSILNLVVSDKAERNIKILLDIESYRERRRKTLEELAENVAQNVIRTGKSIALEPMNSHERKIIHINLQENEKVITTSVGEEPYRKVVVKLK